MVNDLHVHDLLYTAVALWITVVRRRQCENYSGAIQRRIAYLLPTVSAGRHLLPRTGSQGSSSHWIRLILRSASRAFCI
jgi:hypothetical protein